MEKKMTSGEIAKKVGISQKAVRLYDEKGLLKPSDYSEGNYRLYDKEAILVLEKIIALKQIGFSLEEIYENLILGKNMDITDSLNQQLVFMEKKKMEIEKSITCIKGMLARTGGQPDWNDVAEVARTIQMDQEADERHFEALKHTAIERDWYEVIFDTLDLRADSNVLDLGCGFGKLWRNNWKRIPENVQVNAVDLHGSWADDFEKFVLEYGGELSPGTEVRFIWGDAEREEIWSQIQRKEKFDYIIGHYLLDFISDINSFITRVANTLKDGGLFSVNGFEVSSEHIFWKKIFVEIGLKTTFVEVKQQAEEKQKEHFGTLLQKHFKSVKIVTLDNSMRYHNCEEMLERLYQRYPENRKYIEDNEELIRQYFDGILESEDTVIVENVSSFWHCVK